MAWEHLSINKPHLVYIILGGFTTLFMLCSSVIKEKLYIGEATVATICGIIFGPHAADLIDPGSWGNTDQITLEFSRIVLVVQCFAVGVELPKAYMERHWRSVLFLLVPVMTFGWLITSLFIWALFSAHMNWLDSLCVAACVTATDPVLASSVVGKGKFAKRVPKHLRDLLSAESGCNDGMAFPFIYLALYIIRYKHEPNHVALHWFCYTILYECLFGAIYGVAIGYIARRAIRSAHEHDLIDRESFLVFYFVLALFCAGSGSLLGMDDLLVGFAAGVGFSNDGWFTAQTEESHVSNVIDLLINLTFFVYFGTIIPWEQYNAGYLGLDVWRLVVIALLVLFFRRIPIMLALKPLIPDVKTWREALFAGHFGPIGVGAIFVAILARAELETEETTPLAVLPGPDFPHDNIIELIWPITTFLVITSIVVHGSSIAVFTLGKHINTLTLTMSYTQANEGNHWTERLPRIASRSKSQTIGQNDSEIDEKEKGLSPADLRPGTFLRRQREEDNPSHGGSRASSRHRSRRSRNFENGRGPGGPISQSAIHPNRRDDVEQPISRSDSETLAAKSDSPPSTSQGKDDLTHESSNVRDEAQSPGEIFEEGGKTVYEDEEGNVLAVEDTPHEPQAEREKDDVEEGKRLMQKEGANHNHGVAPTKDDPNTDPGHEAAHKAKKATDMSERPASNWRRGISKAGTLTTLAGLRKKDGEEKAKPQSEPKKAHGPARAYQYGNTIIVEDEDGEVIKKYDIPSPDKKTGAGSADTDRTKRSIGRMGKMLGMGGNEAKAAASGEESADASSKRPLVGRKASKASAEDEADDENLRFMLTAGGRRMSKAEFINQIRGMDPKSRVQMVEDSNAPEAVKREARSDAREQAAIKRKGDAGGNVPVVPEHPEEDQEVGNIQRTGSHEDTDLKLVDSNNEDVPVHNISDQLKQYSMRSPTGETAAERRRRQALEAQNQEEDSDDDGTERVPPARIGRTNTVASGGEAGETAAERRRREGALGISGQNDSDSEDDNQPRELPPQQNKNIKFADSAPPPPQQDQGQSSRQGGIKWGKNVRG